MSILTCGAIYQAQATDMIKALKKFSAFSAGVLVGVVYGSIVATFTTFFTLSMM